MSPRATTKAARADKQDRILDAAMALFAERGFYGTPMPSLAKRANVGAGTIYRYFESKESLANALYRREKQRITTWVMQEFPVSRSPRDQFGHLIRSVVSFAQAHPASFVFLEHHHHAPYLDDESRAIEARVMTMVLSFIEQTRVMRITKPVTPQVLISVVWGALARLMKDVEEGRITITATTLDQLEDVLWEAVRV